jgi:phosphoribosylaminoimidazole-succinocarboxamide synthase
LGTRSPYTSLPFGRANLEDRKPVATMLQSNVPGYPCRRGKVRDVYDLGDRLVIVATDRISAFDWVLPTGIPDKGRVLTALTLFWLERLGVPNHLLGTDPSTMGPEFAEQCASLAGRTCLVRKTSVIPFECVARGYLAGSGWKDYRTSSAICGVRLAAGMQLGEKLQQALFTPATKEESGHDQNISFEQMAGEIGTGVATLLRDRTLEVYTRAAEYAASRGILLADTKLEWGMLPGGEIILIDEVLTPDSSRFWPADQYRVGSNPPSFDKQFVRDWLESSGWDKESPAPELPAEVVEKTASKYREAYERLTGKRFGAA